MDSVSDIAFFALLIKHGSLSSAAQELDVTPPAVSRRLAALENRLGIRIACSLLLGGDAWKSGRGFS